jgi:hypothetical protein
MFQVCTAHGSLTACDGYSPPSKQRIRGAIDSRIAEEQARQRASLESRTGSDSSSRHSASRTNSPYSRSARLKKDSIPPGKEPDPAEFDPELIVAEGDGSVGKGPSGPGKETGADSAHGDSDEKANVSDTSNERKALLDSPRAPNSIELPTEVRVKLRRLDKLESRYQGL